MQFYVDDWEADTCELSLAARGLWHTMLMRMHNQNRSGVLTATVDEFARSTHCFPAEFKKVLAELEAKRICEVQRSSGLVTVVNRRMKREADEREAQRLRQLRRRHGDEAEDVTPVSRESNGACHASEAGYARACAVAREEEADIPVTRVSSTPTKGEEEETAASPSGLGAEDLWFAELAKNPAYEGIDIRRCYWKMVAWCEEHGKQATRRRLLNWLNREDRSLPTNGGGNAGQRGVSRIVGEAAPKPNKYSGIGGNDGDHRKTGRS
jgi:uncharacterized protein YdaU (DUF1376 family)